jgi:hypothetical protein
MAAPHPGIRIDQIPVSDTGGLIFAVGMAVVFLLAVPAFVPVVAAAVAGGTVLAGILYWVRN